MSRHLPRDRPRKKPAKGPVTPLTWDEAVKRFTAHLNGPGEAAGYTIRHYARDLDRFAAWWSADPTRKGIALEPHGLVASDLKDYRDHLRAELVCADTKRPRMRKAATVNAIVSALKSFLTWCEDSGVIEEAPEMPKRVRAARPVYKAVPVPDQKRLLRAVERGKSKRDLAMVLVMLDCGLRVAELCALKWRDVKLTRGSAEIYVWHGKGDKQRAVELHGRARLAMVAHAGKAPVPDEPVFKSRKEGKAISPRGVVDVLNKYARGIGLSVSPHQLRHSFATDAMARGSPLPAVQEALGHRSRTTTLMYMNASPADMRRVFTREDGDDEP